MNPEYCISKEKLFHIIKMCVLSKKLFCFSVKGFSMHPFIHSEAKVSVSIKFPLAQIRIGDIIVFFQNNSTIAHRVIHIRKKNKRPYLFITKGDKNKTFDQPINPETIFGKIIKIQQKNQKSINLNRPYWRIIGFVIALISGVSGICNKYRHPSFISLHFFISPRRHRDTEK